MDVTRLAFEVNFVPFQLVSLPLVTMSPLDYLLQLTLYHRLYQHPGHFHQTSHPPTFSSSIQYQRHRNKMSCNQHRRKSLVRIFATKIDTYFESVLGTHLNIGKYFERIADAFV